MCIYFLQLNKFCISVVFERLHNIHLVKVRCKKYLAASLTDSIDCFAILQTDSKYFPDDRFQDIFYDVFISNGYICTLSNTIKIHNQLYVERNIYRTYLKV